QFLADRATGHACDRFAGARALEYIPGIQAVVLERAGEVGVAGTRPCHLTAAALRIGDGIGFGSHDVLPVFPVAVPDQHRDGGAERFAGAHAGEPFDVVGFDLPACAAAVT